MKGEDDGIADETGTLEASGSSKPRCTATTSGGTTKLATLLQFTLLYAAWRSLTRKRSHAIHMPATLPSTRAILGFIVALSLASFVVRLWWPLRWDWSPPWWMQLFSWTGGLLPQYLSLYVLGCMAYRRNWFAQLTPKMGRAWSLLALIAMILAVPFMIVGMATGTLNDITGGFHWQALLMAVWEAFLVVGVRLGSLALIRERWKGKSRLVVY